MSPRGIEDRRAAAGRQTEDDAPDDAIDLDQWQEIVNLLAGIARVRSAAITRVDLPFIEAVAVSESPDNPLHRGLRVELINHYCEEVITRRERVLVEDARTSERWKRAPELEHGLVSYLGYPIRTPEGNIYGTLCVHDSKQNSYSDDIDRLMKQLVAVIESQFSLLLSVRKLERQAREIAQLRGIIPICSHCKQVRRDDGYWQQVEVYISEHSEAAFSHGICPTCMEIHYRDCETEE